MAVPPDTTRPTLGRSELDVFGGTRGSVAKGELSDAKFDGVRTHGARGTAFALGVRTVDLMDGVGEGDNGGLKHCVKCTLLRGERSTPSRSDSEMTFMESIDIRHYSQLRSYPLWS